MDQIVVAVVDAAVATATDADMYWPYRFNFTVYGERAPHLIKIRHLDNLPDPLSNAMQSNEYYDVQPCV